MSLLRPPLAGLLLFLVIWSEASCQDHLRSPEAIYEQALAGQLLLYNGHSYQRIPEPYEGTPYFGDDLWNVGTVVYEGQPYEDIDLFYDTYQDKLVIEHHDINGYPTYFYPPAERVDFFILKGHRFVTLDAALRNVNKLSGGYYHQLYEGGVILYAKRKTGLYKEEKQGKFIPVFKNEDTYFMQLGQVVQEVRSKSSVKKLFPEQKKEINRFVRQNNLMFSPDSRGYSLTRLAEFCDTLTPQGDKL